MCRTLSRLLQSSSIYVRIFESGVVASTIILVILNCARSVASQNDAEGKGTYCWESAYRSNSHTANIISHTSGKSSTIFSTCVGFSESHTKVVSSFMAEHQRSWIWKHNAGIRIAECELQITLSSISLSLDLVSDTVYQENNEHDKRHQSKAAATTYHGQMGLKHYNSSANGHGFEAMRLISQRPLLDQCGQWLRSKGPWKRSMNSKHGWEAAEW